MAMAKSIPTFALRLMALGATISATIVMVTSHDSATVLNLKFDAKYTNSPSFKYFVIINAIASGYGLITLFLPSKSSLWRLVLVLDLVILSLLDSTISAALAIGYVGKKGNTHAGWLPICSQVPKFCDRVTGALISSFIATIIYFLLLLYSLHNVINLLTDKA
ncbi:CASP-like protein 1C1 [Actinidia eriantha]|uniref:CASP-like protein 1C1 n=1 Tax=Actinidia eriantha TaxID=165200 RepID=UPI002590C515|nr:CASP-like protein 1C1 [Actinidia eriantha]